MRKLWAALLIGCVLAFLTSAIQPEISAAQSTAERITQTGVLRVGLEGTYPPFNFLDNNGNLVGFDVDMSIEIARRLGVRAEFVQGLWTSLIERLRKDEFDVIIAQMSVTEERLKLVDFTDPYATSGTMLVARAGDDRFTQLNDIAGHIVGVGQGTTFETLAHSVEGADVRVYDDFEAYSQALIAGDVDVIIEDELTAAYNIKEHGLPLQITYPAVAAQSVAIAVQKGNQTFIDELNRILTEMKADGTYRTIHMKWFGSLHVPRDLP